jgi:hypothetical protein
MGALAAAKAVVAAIFSTSADFTVATAHPAAAEHPHIFRTKQVFFYLFAVPSQANSFTYLF